MHKYIVLLAAIGLAGCSQPADEAASTASEPGSAPAPAAEASVASSAKLAAILASQPEEVQARYAYRNPQQTLEFFGIEPGMVVVEALPGGGWYTKILLPYLGEDGRLIGADYARDMYANFSFATDEFLENKKTWVDQFKAGAAEWAGEDGAEVDAFVFGALPQEMHGTADAVLLVRAMHNLARFEEDGGYLTQALTDINNVLRPGGIVGIVQHHARDDMPDDFADGSRGYLKQSFVIEAMNAAGFDLVDSSDINANPADQPGPDDIVWRLPPTLGTSGDDEALRAQMQAIGESNRMTLKFVKR